MRPASVRPRNRNVARISLREKGLIFSSTFIRANNFQDDRFVSIFLDDRPDGGTRIYLRFSRDSGQMVLSRNSSQAKVPSRQAISRHLMRANPELAAALADPDLREQTPQYDRDQGMFYIVARPAFTGHATQAEVADGSFRIRSGELGVYRYIAAGEVIYIGQGDVRMRLLSRDWAFDRVEWFTTLSKASALLWEHALLDAHRKLHGRLPLHNKAMPPRPSAVTPK